MSQLMMHGGGAGMNETKRASATGEKIPEVLAPASLVSLMCIYHNLALLFSLFKIKAPDIRSPGT